MKTFMILLYAFCAINSLQMNQETRTVTAVFEGFDDDVYYFTDAEGNAYDFERIEEEAKDKFNLTKEEYLGKTFNIIYLVESEIDEFNDSIEVLVITDIKLVE
jgi:hypothetical protein